jgi:CHASE2 domain-containing sensor protein
MLQDVALLALLVATVFVVLEDAQPVRPFVVFAAACLVPGGAILTRLRTGEGMTDLALAIGLSLAVEIAGSLALAWSRWWHPEALAIVLAGASAALLLSDLLWTRRR